MDYENIKYDGIHEQLRKACYTRKCFQNCREVFTILYNQVLTLTVVETELFENEDYE